MGKSKKKQGKTKKVDETVFRRDAMETGPANLNVEVFEGGETHISIGLIDGPKVAMVVDVLGAFEAAHALVGHVTSTSEEDMNTAAGLASLNSSTTLRRFAAIYLTAARLAQDTEDRYGDDVVLPEDTPDVAFPNRKEEGLQREVQRQSKIIQEQRDALSDTMDEVRIYAKHDQRVRELVDALESVGVALDADLAKFEAEKKDAYGEGGDRS